MRASAPPLARGARRARAAARRRPRRLRARRGRGRHGGARARHARLRRETGGGADRPGPAVLRDGAAAARAQLRREDALRRRLRAVDRRARRRPRGRPARSTGSSTSTASRASVGRGRGRAARRRPRLVGPPRLGRHAARPGGRRLVPRAVRARGGGQALSRSCWSAPTTSTTPARRSPSDSARPARSPVARRSAPAWAREPLRVLVGTLERRCAPTRRSSRSTAARRRAACSRASATTGRALELLDAKRRAGAARSVAGAGLVAATRFEEQAPTWAITGTDAAGVAAAARALDERTLQQRFALALDGSHARSGCPWRR